jgi:hypothetical protein
VRASCKQHSAGEGVIDDTAELVQTGNCSRLLSSGVASSRRERFATIAITRSPSIRSPLAVQSGREPRVTAIGVKQPRAPGCAETSRLASKRLELCLLSAYAAR